MVDSSERRVVREGDALVEQARRALRDAELSPSLALNLDSAER